MLVKCAGSRLVGDISETPRLTGPRLISDISALTGSLHALLLRVRLLRQRLRPPPTRRTLVKYSTAGRSYTHIIFWYLTIFYLLFQFLV